MPDPDLPLNLAGALDLLEGSSAMSQKLQGRTGRSPCSLMVHRRPFVMPPGRKGAAPHQPAVSCRRDVRNHLETVLAAMKTIPLSRLKGVSLR